jgi:excinuclease ABC subunit A
MEPDQILVRGARQHNLRALDLSIPRYKLVVITGVSGSGKSSLAFDTIYAEGQRRYVESLSAYARQFLGQMEKPKVDSISGLSPAIAIEQKAVSKNPRSTVGTVTEVMDYLRVLYARVGIPHCPDCGRPVEAQSAQQIARQIAGLPAGTRLLLLAPIVRNRKGSHAEALEAARAAGFVRARIDGQIQRLDGDPPALDKKKRHDIELVVDRLTIPEAAPRVGSDEASEKASDEASDSASETAAGELDSFRTRLVDSVETALKVGEGLMALQRLGGVDSDGDPALGDSESPDASTSDATDSDPSPLELYSEHHACAHCGFSFPELSPAAFSFNSPLGMCPDCNGLGTRIQVDPELILEDPSLSLMDGALRWYGELRKKEGSWLLRSLRAIADHYEIDLETPWQELPEHFRQVLFHGSGEDKIRFTWGSEGEDASWSGESVRATHGLIHQIDRLYHQTSSEGQRKRYGSYMDQQPCGSCEGTRLRPEARGVTVGGRTISQVSAMSIAEAHAWVSALSAGGGRAEVRDPSAGRTTGAAANGSGAAGTAVSDTAAADTAASDTAAADTLAATAEPPPTLDAEGFEIAEEVLKEIGDRLQFMLNVGLHYLALDRAAPTLSGGEGQRIRLASQIGCGLVGVLYILDEPSIGLHARDNRALLDTLHRLRDMGNTVLVVEHDEETMRESDWLIDLGPGAGVLGGQLMAAGPPAEVAADPDSVTGQFLRGEKRITRPGGGKSTLLRRPADKGQLTIVGARLHNLCEVTAHFPLGCLVCVTGVSGSGKSSLVAQTLYPALMRSLHDAQTVPGAHRRIDGLDQLDKVVNITQDPIGRTPRSNPATYVGFFDEIRKVFASTTEARSRGYKPGRFSFNVKRGRCQACEGYGRRKVEMHFLADVWVLCRECEGARFNRDTLAVLYRGKNIAEVLEMDVAEALAFFEHHPPIARKLQTLHDVGLDYIKLGQSALTLSGGEAQRIKLAKELSKVATGRTLYILDEPTTGLHFVDIQKLLEVLHRLVDEGNTVVVIEHNLDVVKTADHLIDLGPDGGTGGGRIVAEGTPEEVAAVEASYTGQFLRKLLTEERVAAG